MRRTKIVATIGPASDSPEILAQLIRAGANIFRLNFSHGTAAEHTERATRIREIAYSQGVEVGLLGDLQGPKIRIAKLPVDRIELSNGFLITLDASLADGEGEVDTNSARIGVDFKTLPDCVGSGDILLLDDGRIRLRVSDVQGSKVHCTSESEGELFSRKGINRLGGGLSAPALTEKDIKDIDVATALNLEYVAVSFPSNAEDIHTARGYLEKAGCKAAVIGKVERAEAVADHETLDKLIIACDGIMVARGDLGVEVGDAQLVGLQKHMIKRARQLNRVVITATQMMESMIENPVPTRAEVFDVANAVLDGSDAVMLSAETAAGEYPVATVKAMAETCVGAERSPSIRRSGHRLDQTFDSYDETIAMSAMYAANHLQGVKGLIALTESGRTAMLMSRLSSGLPIYAFSRHKQTCGRAALYRGVLPVHFDIGDLQPAEVERSVLDELYSRGLVEKGDRLIFTQGDNVGITGHTNTMKVIQV